MVPSLLTSYLGLFGLEVHITHLKRLGKSQAMVEPGFTPCCHIEEILRKGTFECVSVSV